LQVHNLKVKKYSLAIGERESDYLFFDIFLKFSCEAKITDKKKNRYIFPCNDLEREKFSQFVYRNNVKITLMQLSLHA